MSEKLNRRTVLSGIGAGLTAGLAGCSGGNGSSNDQNQLLTGRRFSDTREAVETVFDDLIEVNNVSNQARNRTNNVGVPLDPDVYNRSEGQLVSENLVLASENVDSPITREDSNGELMNFKDVDTLDSFGDAVADPSSIDYNAVVRDIEENLGEEVDNLNVSGQMENMMQRELSDWDGIRGYFAEDVTGEDELSFQHIDIGELRNARDQIDRSIAQYTSAINTVNRMQEGVIAQIEDELDGFLADPEGYGEESSEVQNPSNRFNTEDARDYLQGESSDSYDFSEFVNLSSGGQSHDPDRSNLFEDMEDKTDERGINGVSDYMSQLGDSLAQEAGVAFQAREVLDYVIETAQNVNNEDYTDEESEDPHEDVGNQDWQPYADELEDEGLADCYNDEELEQISRQIMNDSGGADPSELAFEMENDGGQFRVNLDSGPKIGDYDRSVCQ